MARMNIERHGDFDIVKIGEYTYKIYHLMNLKGTTRADRSIYRCGDIPVCICGIAADEGIALDEIERDYNRLTGKANSTKCVDDIECIQCHIKFDGGDATNHDTTDVIRTVICPHCQKQMDVLISVEYTAQDLSE